MPTGKKLLILADMLVTDEDALICDFAETYGIYDYKSLPLSRAAIFAVGLRDSSRIKMKMAGAEYPLETILLAALTDRMGTLVWMQSEDGAEGVNRPSSFLAKLFHQEDAEERAHEVFDTPEAFETRKKVILQEGGV